MTKKGSTQSFNLAQALINLFFLHYFCCPASAEQHADTANKRTTSSPRAPRANPWGYGEVPVELCEWK